MSKPPSRTDFPPPPDSGKFKPIKDAKQVDKLLSQASKVSAACLVWAKEPSKATGKDPDSARFATQLVGADPELRVLQLAPFAGAQKASASGQLWFLNLTLPHTTLLFRSELIGVFSSFLKFKYPTEIFEVQRRESFRLQISESYEMKVAFDAPGLGRLSREIVDISSGGLAFLIAASGDEAKTYGTGIRLTQAEVALRGKGILCCELEVRHVSEWPPWVKRRERTGRKVGVKFLDLPPADANLISAFVLEEARKQFAEFFE